MSDDQNSDFFINNEKDLLQEMYRRKADFQVLLEQRKIR